MIRRMVDKSHVGMVISTDYDDEEDISFCEQCQKQGTLSKLKELIYLDDNGKLLPNPPPDADSWRRCWTCGLVVPTKDVKRESRISGITGIEILSNPYDEKKGLILGNDSRLTSRIKNLKRRQNKHPDNEVQKFIDDGYELISYQNYTPGE